MPNTIAQNLARLQTARISIADAITAKGGTVNNGDGFEQFPVDIASIPSGGGNFDEIVKSTKPRLVSSNERFYTKFSIKTWNGIGNFYGNNIWTDGTDIYYSEGSDHQYVLDKSTSTWTSKTWNGIRDLYGKLIWTDGTDIYYSNGSAQYVLDKSTSTWTSKTWNGFTRLTGSLIWTDGTDIYYSNGSAQYVLDKSTSTWTSKTWNEKGFYGDSIWTDGTDIYYSEGSFHYVLDKSTSTWTSKTWNRIGNFYGNFYGKFIWTDGTNIYYSCYDPYSSYNSAQCVLDKSTSTWITISWDGGGTLNGDNIWTDGTDIYNNDNNGSTYILKLPASTVAIPTVHCLPTYT